MGPSWGKYRGVVINNVDPLGLGRLNVAVPDVSVYATVGPWAMPCVPYAGPGVGFCMTPPIGASVWVEFEMGDTYYPIWTGCFWQEGERPVAASPTTMQMIQTQSGLLAFNDLTGEGGGFTLSTGEPAVELPVWIIATASGLKIARGEVGVEMLAAP